jgi:hypothetical protein
VAFEASRGTAPAVIWIGVVLYWLLVPLAVFGGVVARRRRLPIYPLLAFPLIAVLSSAATIGAFRYRAQSEVSLVLLAALALDRMRRSASAAAPHGGAV